MPEASDQAASLEVPDLQEGGARKRFHPEYGPGHTACPDSPKYRMVDDAVGINAVCSGAIMMPHADRAIGQRLQADGSWNAA